MHLARLFAPVLLVPAALLALAGCAVDPAPRYDPISFAHKGRIPLEVARITVERRYQSPGVAPHVEQDFPIRPETPVETWAYERLQPVGVSGEAVLVIEEASAIEEKLARSGGLRGAMTTEQDARYTVSYKVSMNIWNAEGRHRGEVTASAEQARTLPENVSLNDRYQFYHRLTREAMTALDVTLERNIRDHLASFIRP